MFYYLSNLSDVFFGFNIFKYITFRAGMAAVTTFVLCIVFGPIIIRSFRKLQIGENVKRDDCPQLYQLHSSKEGTPTMGGLFIIGSIVVSVLLWADLTNRFILLTLVTCLWLAVLGGIDDYIKLTQKGRRGLRAGTKFVWQLVLGFIIGIFIYFNPASSTQLDVPFLKNLIIDLGVLYIPFVILVIVGTSNAVNLTDGLDGLAIGCVLIVTIALGMLSYVSGHLKFSEYLFIPFVPGAGELTIFCAAILGASLGFLWFNCYPATVFMGDVGSLALGGSLGVIAVLIKKELLLGLLGGIFVIEALSVILQVGSFKLTGKRIFKVSPLHHHLQLSGWNESKIIIRFWIIAIILALLTLTTLKIR
ncbi:MAG TPA: phospho-N-acetylmuramoyl-pentapeptide-transferase [Candidatus Omnitrophota bacterium]|nr:phospho-N-acetylmuramoyl-pentapeptide-transferase [Candidatus Omnitrophota bacterium]HPD85101.1 phospho-N-acetylmuramoyl-pentapeptide-transferase [Candidatus Omnitrophota bacterium]HRZ03959.1 phospho-N-acetylmuramoyl-pentapeptide-transferase [Candidatus Omnitrophota bacterium]